MMRISYFALLVLIMIGFSGCQATDGATDLAGAGAETASAPQELTRVRVPMGFVPDPQFAPVYVADEKGYFADEGLEIEFDYSFETDGIALVGANELPLAIVSGEQVILGRAQDLPLVYVMEWFQRFPVAIVSRAEAGIETPEQLEGKTVGIPGFFGASYVGYVGLLSAAGVEQENVTAEEIGFTQIEALLDDRVDAAVGYANNEPVQLAQQGVETNVIYVADYIDLVANGVVTNERTMSENPQLVRGFVHALLRGLQDTLADPDEAFEISKAYVEDLDDNRRGVLDASLPLWEAETLGLTASDSWSLTHDILLQADQLDAPVEDLDAAYDNQFVLDFDS